VGEHQVAVIGLEIPDSETQTFPLVSLDPMSKPGLHPCISVRVQAILDTLKAPKSNWGWFGLPTARRWGLAPA